MTEIQRHPEANANVLRRLWIFQSERFPLFKTVLLLLVFTAASICVSALLADRELPGIVTFVSIWVVTIILFFQMRVCDEWKDLEDDRKYRPERPVPSGLVSLKLLFSMAAIGALIAISLTTNLFVSLVALLFVIWAWLGLMTFEFFMPEWLKRHQIAYLVSHMMIMPLIDLFITAAEWMQYGSTPPNFLWLFLVLSFVNGCVLEIGRKIWAPESELEGVDSYSAIWGYSKSTIIWLAICNFAWVLLLMVGFATGYPLATAIPGLIALLYVFYTARKFLNQPDEKTEKAIEDVAGIWVFSCYCSAGFAPLIVGVV
ncbi:MAG: UbiA family prenyltransferase [Rhizobiaceae bacterium]|nr:UbiA family prenyltransferase [Rhizobiaceae bacterium]